MRKVIFGVVCMIVGFTAGKHLYDIKRYIQRKRQMKEYHDFISAMAKLFEKAAEAEEKEEEESQ